MGVIMKKEKNFNNKGFTLIEVLAVLVILGLIMAIAIPNITDSLDRQSCKMVETRVKLIESAAQFYVSDNRNKIKITLSTKTDKKCKISIDKLTFNNKYLTDNDLKDGNETISGYVIYNQGEETYNFCFTTDTCSYNTNCDSTLTECVSS